jgi:hypothetical protein
MAILYDSRPPPDGRPRPRYLPGADSSSSMPVRMDPFFPHPQRGSITLLGDYGDDFPPVSRGTGPILNPTRRDA